MKWEIMEFLKNLKRDQLLLAKMTGAVHYAGCKHGLKSESAAGKMAC